MRAPLVIGVDVGTTKIEAVIYDAEGRAADRAVVRNKTFSGDGRAEQDPSFIAGTVESMLRRAHSMGVRCAGLAVYRGSLVAWDREGIPLTRILTWMDLRPHMLWRRMPPPMRLARRLPGIGEAFSPESLVARLKALLIENRRLADLLSRGEAMAWNLDSYLTYRLTGVFAADSSTAALTGLIHPASLKPLELVRRIASLPRIPLPRLLPHDGSWSLETRAGPRLAAVIGDQQAASVGVNCLDPGCLKASLGTGFFLDQSTGEKLITAPGGGLLPVILKAGKNSVYGVEAYATGLGMGVEWFVINILGGDYNALDKSLSKSSKPPLVSPYIWGSRTPRLWRGAAGLAGVMPGHTIWDIAAGLAHSTAAAVAILYRALEERTGQAARVVLVGGLSRLRGLSGLIASYLGRGVLRASTPGSASALGAALLASEACGTPIEPNISYEEVDPGEYDVLVEPEQLIEAARTLERLAGSWVV